MSRLGRIYLSAQTSVFLGGGMDGDTPAHSEQTAREVDLEVRAIVDGCLNEVRTLLDQGRNALAAVAQRLIEKEVLEDRELLELLEASGFPISARARQNLLEHNAYQSRMVDQITASRVE
jgi:cell division protease FtsH